MKNVKQEVMVTANTTATTASQEFMRLACVVDPTRDNAVSVSERKASFARICVFLK